MKLIISISLFSLLQILSQNIMAQEPHNSFFELPSSNGYSSVHYSYKPEDHKIAAFYPHIYKKFSPSTPETPNLLFDAYFGVRTNTSSWLSSITEDSVGYEPGSGIIYVDKTVPGAVNPISVRTYIFSSFEIERPVFIMVFEVSGPTEPFSVFSLHNLHMGTGDFNTENETITPYGNGWIETGREGYGVYYRPLVLPDGVVYDEAGGMENPWQLMQNGGDFLGGATSVTGNDIAIGTQYNFPAGITAGETIRIAIVVGSTDKDDVDSLVTDVDSYVGSFTPSELLDLERANWASFQARAILPENISDDEETLLRQGLAVMRFAQVREENEGESRPNGQILAAIPKARPENGEGIWNIAWVRDASYGITALAHLGYYEEAKKALSFMLNARSGEYEQAVGIPYLISVCRYYGYGREETDYDSNGPNIEFDDFGLFLWAFSETVNANINDTWWQEYWPSVRDLVADALVKLTEKHSFLIAPDSSIWERHWNGNQKHFTYSTIMAIKGLCGAANLADKMNEPEKAAEYRDTVSKLIKGVKTFLIDSNNVLAGNLEELQSGSGYIDLAAIEAMNHGIISPEDPVYAASLNKYKDFFDGIQNGNGGYYRNDDGDWYDNQEWSFIDLRMSVALSHGGYTQERDALLNWVVNQSKANNWLMGELYCRGNENCNERGDYKGSIPMVGFGPGAFILALEARNQSEPPSICASVSDETPGLDDPNYTTGKDAGTTNDASPTSGGGGNDGCSCKHAGTGSSPLFPKLILLLLPIALFLRRKNK